MAFTAGIAPSVGDTIQAATGVAFGSNDDWLRGKADIDHDFDISTGTGFHRAKYNAGLRLVNPDAGNTSAAQAYLDRNGRLRLKSATGTTTPPTPASDSDQSEAWLAGAFAHVDAAISLPSQVYTSLNAYRISPLIDLRDERWMRNLAKFRQLSRNTSWYAEVGHMPTRMFIVIPHAQSSVVIYNADDMSAWMTFTLASNNALPTDAGAVSVTDVCFSDGWLYVGTSGDGVVRVDFQIDEIFRWFAAGPPTTKYRGRISDRNSGLGYLGMASNAAIVANAVNAVAAIRDPLGAVEADTGRPKHRVVVATESNTIGSVSNAGISAFYDWISFSPGAYTNKGAFLTPSGSLFSILRRSSGSASEANWIYNIHSISGDGFNRAMAWRNNNAGSTRIPFGDNFIPGGIAAIEGASVADGASPVVIFGSDEGLAISHAKENDNTNGLTFVINATANWPPYSSTVVDVWALENANGLFGKNLTNNNGVTFAAGVIGSGAVGDGVSKYLSRTGDADFTVGTGNWSVSCWIKSNTATNPGATQCPWTLFVSGSDITGLAFDTGGQLVFTITNDNGSTSDVITFAQDIYDAAWHHAVAQRNGSTWELYVDGVRVGTTAVNNAAASLDFDSLNIFANQTPGLYFNGMVDHFSPVKGRALSADEIRGMYKQGLDSMQAAANGLPSKFDANDIDYVAVDPRGQFAGVGNENKMYIINKWGNILATHASPAGNIQSVQVWSEPGTDEPSYIIGTSTRIETVQQNPKLLER